MVYPRLARLGAAVARAHQPDQGPEARVGVLVMMVLSVTRSTPPPDLCHQRPPRVPLAGVPAALPVPGAHHLLVDADSDAGGGVPLLAHRAAHRHHLRRLQHLGQGGGVSSYRGAPAAAAPWAW